MYARDYDVTVYLDGSVHPEARLFTLMRDENQEELTTETSKALFLRLSQKAPVQRPKATL